MSIYFVRVLLIAGIILLGATVSVQRAYAMNTAPTYTSDGYWWMDDDETVPDNDTNTGYGAGNVAQETDITGVARNTSLRLRFDISETANQDMSATHQWRIEYKSGAAGCTDASWTALTTSAVTNDWYVAATGNITNGDTTGLNRITGQAVVWKDTEKYDTQNDSVSEILDNKSDEIEWNIQATDNSTYDTLYTFRVTDAGTALNSYSYPSNCPRATTGSVPVSTKTQFEYRWWTDTANIVPSGPWGTPDIAKNTAILFNNEAVQTSDILRLRISIDNAVAECVIDCEPWKLQFATLSEGQACSGGTYGDLATDGSCSGAWCIDDNASYADGAALSDCAVGGNNCISTANIEEEAEDSDNVWGNPIAFSATEDAEWDFNMNAFAPANATQYCFKIVHQSDGSDLEGGYTNYPQLITIPGVSNLMRHGKFFDSTGTKQGYYWAN